MHDAYFLLSPDRTKPRITKSILCGGTAPQQLILSLQFFR